MDGDGETSWISHCCDDNARKIDEFDSLSELSDEGSQLASAVSVDVILPDDILEQILAYLPVASIFRARSVCKRWQEIVISSRFLSQVPSQKPWYFMFTSSDEPRGCAYDHILRKWYHFSLTCIGTSNWFIASSCGLVSFMDRDSRSELYIGNPITNKWRKLAEPPGLKFSDYSALAMSVTRASNGYKISIVKSKQVPDNFFQWDISIHLYDSETMMWATLSNEVVAGWRATDESVICDGILYFLIYYTGGGLPENRHRLIKYDLTGRSSHSLIRNFVPVPCPLTCGRLMNLQQQLVMVGGIGKQDRPDIIKGIGIWMLRGREWQEVARMPHKCFQGFGELDDVFASSGTDELIYIQSYGRPSLLVFDMNQKQWKWATKCPVTKKFPLQLFTGFSFEPRLGVAP